MLDNESEISRYFAKFNATLPVYAPVLSTAIMDTPLGNMLAVWSNSGLCLLEFVGQQRLDKELRAVAAAKQARIVWYDKRFMAQAAGLQQNLAAYFSGSLKQFNVPLDCVGTDFQQQVWRQLCCIPYGKTMSYQEQAAAIGKPRAVRAVAAANGQNKISIVVPCHRVIGSNGKLTGYAGGLTRKQALLCLEAEHSVNLL